MKIDGRQYTVFFRDALQAAQDEVMRAKPDDLYWGRHSRTGKDASSADASTASSLARRVLSGRTALVRRRARMLQQETYTRRCGRSCAMD